MNGSEHPFDKGTLAARYAALWQDDAPAPDLVAFLSLFPEAPAAERLEALLVDQANRARRGADVPLAEYARLFPDLLADPEIKGRLALNFLAVQGRLDDWSARARLAREFPDLADRLLGPNGCSHGLEATHDAPPAPADDSTPTGPAASEKEDADLIGVILGRYHVERLLGRGGFGQVYLAHDRELDRRVALKVPHRRLLRTAGDAEAFLAEARNLAMLDHPVILPVHDVGRTEDGLCYAVSKYVEGTSVAEWAARTQPSRVAITGLVASLAEALHHAHQRGLVHRDVKPANILVDKQGSVYLADFGLALKDDDFGNVPGYAGTPAYMSPEQARGEGHRVDGRSDIFSLGIVLYELLSGRRPFRAADHEELLEQIIRVEARPLRQIDDTIPRELDRICLKALAKRAPDRYSTALDLAEDLRHWMRSVTATAAEASRPAAPPPEAADGGPMNAGGRPGGLGATGPAKVIPKGLRSFDAEDADFFLQLLPGPVDRDGLPESLRFWRNRIETADGTRTFPVGLLYGPSGCGKSSLVKAGLLPRLAGTVKPVYLEAAPGDTEARLLAALWKCCPSLAGAPSLIDAVAALRRQPDQALGSKFLLVIDQFEQWLHVHQADEDPELVRALRQCDGERVQVLLLVRDDFWMAAARFMRALEIPLVEGQNAQMVDLFDGRHSRKVLAEFGRSLGCLPAAPTALTADQERFLDQAIAALTRDGRVVPVRLSLFAEMVKGKPWTPATLRAVGGAEGVGVTFLEETFSAPTAPPSHRLHQAAVRAVLQALLPEPGADIKGQMRSQRALLEIAGYSARPGDFADLLRILDTELRLVTPADRVSLSAEGGSSKPAPDEKYYQLTHDYLVPSLREWLTRKQKETARGRAELRLAERAQLWTARPERRFLPSLLEWLRIEFFTRRRSWSESEQRVMRVATRYHVFWLAVTGLLTLLTLTAGLVTMALYHERRQQEQAATLVQQLSVADTEQAPGIIAAMEPYRRWVDPQLVQIVEDTTRAPRVRLHARLALLPVDPGQVTELQTRLLSAEADEFFILRQELTPHRARLIDPLAALAAAEGGSAEAGQRFRAACALALYDPQHPCWRKLGRPLAEALIAQNPVFLKSWMKALHPVREVLRPALLALSQDTERSGEERLLATTILASYFDDEADFLVELLCQAGNRQFTYLMPTLGNHRQRAAARLKAELTRTAQPDWNDPPPADAGSRPDAAVATKLAAAQGLLTEHVALCQTLPAGDFPTIAEGLRAAGYRPTSFRPYLHGDAVLVAAVWQRDGRDWQCAQGLTAEALRTRAAALEQAGFLPIDVSGYAGPGEKSLSFSALWVRRTPDDPSGRLLVSLTEAQKKEELARLPESSVLVTQTECEGDGGRLYSAVWHTSTRPAGSSLFSGRGSERWFRKQQQWHRSLRDVRIDRIGGNPADTRTRYTGERARAEDVLRVKPRDVEARLRHGVAAYHLGDLDTAIKDLTAVIDQEPNRQAAYFYRILAEGRRGNLETARRELLLYTLRASQRTRAEEAYLDAVLSVFAGEDEAGMKRLAFAVSDQERNPAFLVYAARAYALASGILAPRDLPRSRAYGLEAVRWLGRALADELAPITTLQDPDFDAIRKLAEFQALRAPLQLGIEFAAVWQPSPDFESLGFSGETPEAHRERGRALLAEGYRPAVVSVAWPADAVQPVIASVWRRPFVREQVKDLLAHRQANAVLALSLLEAPDALWPALRATPDPRLRSLLIHQLGARGLNARLVVQRLDAEPDVSVQRSLLLCLGEFPDEKLSPKEREALVPKVRKLFAEHPDAGMHAAAEWLLRRWGRTEALAHSDRPGSGLPPPGKGWFRDGQGHTLVVVAEPGTVALGSPGNEPDRSETETVREVRIDHRFAVAAKEVTRAQFNQFRNAMGRNLPDTTAEFLEDLLRLSDGAGPANPARLKPGALGESEDCPVYPVSYYTAAAYCRWLSEKEGIPEDQMCYPPLAQLRDGYKPYPNYLKRTGYRLPTPAEWEYACRAGTVTSRYFGQAEELLPQYAWYAGNSKRIDLSRRFVDPRQVIRKWQEGQARSWPGGSLKPNDLGLFDMLGNVLEWCEAEEGAPAGARNLESNARPVRGGSFLDQPANVRAAAQTTENTIYLSRPVGFRVVRTLPQVGP